MNKRILLVATESDIVQAIPIPLRLAGHDVLMVDCGLEAIKRARDLSPDLILVDAMLPDMDGSTLVDILRRLPSTGDLRTLLFKPRTQREASNGQAGHDPVNSPELLEQIRQALEMCLESSAPEPDSEWSGMEVV